MDHPDYGLSEGVLTYYLEQHGCRVCPGTLICSKGTILSSLIKHEEQSLSSAIKDLPNVDTHKY